MSLWWPGTSAAMPFFRYEEELLVRVVLGVTANVMRRRGHAPVWLRLLLVRLPFQPCTVARGAVLLVELAPARVGIDALRFVMQRDTSQPRTAAVPAPVPRAIKLAFRVHGTNLPVAEVLHERGHAEHEDDEDEKPNQTHARHHPAHAVRHLGHGRKLRLWMRRYSAAWGSAARP